MRCWLLVGSSPGAALPRAGPGYRQAQPERHRPPEPPASLALEVAQRGGPVHLLSHRTLHPRQARPGGQGGEEHGADALCGGWVGARGREEEGGGERGRRAACSPQREAAARRSGRSRQPAAGTPRLPACLSASPASQACSCPPSPSPHPLTPLPAPPFQMMGRMMQAAEYSSSMPSHTPRSVGRGNSSLRWEARGHGSARGTGTAAKRRQGACTPRHTTRGARLVRGACSQAAPQ